jgi:hypothetical protein
MTETDRIRDACLMASADLGVRIVTPFSLIGRNGLAVEFIALFPDFGSAKGTAVCHFRDWPAKQGVASAHGLFCAGLHPESYGEYDRAQFVDTFIDWGWWGRDSDRPEWLRVRPSAK